MFLTLEVRAGHNWNGTHKALITGDDVMWMAYTIVNQSGRKLPFQDGMAGHLWFNGFRSHRPNLYCTLPSHFHITEQLLQRRKPFMDFFAILGENWCTFEFAIKDDVNL